MTTTDDGAEPATPGEGPRGPAEPVAADPAISYPRGNRLGLRHPRPTVVIAVAVILLVGGAFMWNAVASKESRICDLGGTLGTPTASSPEGAFHAWFDQTHQNPSTLTTTPGSPMPPSDVDQFTREGDTWVHRDGDRGMKVDVGPASTGNGYAVIAANACSWQRL